MSLIHKSIYGQIPDILRESTDRRCTDFLARPNIHGGISLCALGTIYHRAGISPKDILLMHFNRKEAFAKLGIPEIPKNNMKCPSCGARATFRSLIAHLNDVHDFTWGKIADQLEAAQSYDESVSRWQKFKDDLRLVFGNDFDRLFSIFTPR